MTKSALATTALTILAAINPSSAGAAATFGADLGCLRKHTDVVLLQD